MNRLEEEVHELCQSIVGLRGVVESSITEKSRVSTRMISCMTQLLDAIGRTYQAFDNTLVSSSRVPYQRHVRPKTCEFTLILLDVLQGFSFFLQMGLTLILAILDGLNVGLLGDVIGEDDCDDDG
nr:hypothetical protein [Tanacetum cinerariifolium]